MTASALVAGIVAIGSMLGDRGPDDSVTLVPTSDPSPKGRLDESPPDNDSAAGIPTAASTAGPSPSVRTPGGDESEDAGPAGSGPPSPGDDPTGPGDDRSTEPAPGPRATNPGRRPSDPPPSTPGDPDPEPTTEPTTPPDEPTPDPTSAPPEPPESAPGCTALAEVVSTRFLGTGFTAAVTITNRSSTPLLGWTSAFTLPSGYSITEANNVEVVEDGRDAVVRGAGPTSIMDPEASVTFEITTGGLGRPGEPWDFSVNGVACD